MFLKITGGRKKTLSDEELAAHYRKNGDMILLGELYGRHMEMVFAVCFKYLKDEEASKDAVMQLFEKLSGDLRRHEVSNFKGWLHQVTRNYCLMHLRSAQNKFRENMVSIENELSGDVETTAFLHPDNGEILENQLRKVEAGIGQLPPEQQQCVRLFYLDQKCYKDIAEMTGYELKKVKSYIQNGKRNLKLFMEAQKNEQ
ncbi:RNA polymerase sigma-70 factor (ECF subfamily) [Anseongella ginsenosidimutans]|uniref:RNA polymerase sigma-70 factor (ECF subfamily) n=1 Tax=Anseongella ginsenosidimutans TaxID=496056 RepID=A0A4R3L072_9SPHI|nr:sigma-70 family RNA polymerase sigma factor [Anseongella ginsenosidimutans]QEC51450.1 sigma-70 family RNA polymerase sigma factor [Anseongella ginsenosidimutans]TCS89842.1 RNA polymerase sigma-70 factor (ECF subfamily) [Anseongella ginsenosidimutans]